MKKINLLFAFLAIGILLAASLFAQEPKWVSKEVTKRNVVLEEFTGIHCGWCPDGHWVANQLAAANPGRVIIVNNHCGPYAKPSNAYQPDLRTKEGALIASKFNIESFPSASINRSTEQPMLVGKWKSAAKSIMKQDSPVNIYVKPTLDYDTRKLTVEVELYYTGTVSTDKNYLTVMLLQNEILGYQNGALYNYKYIDLGGQYRHMHTLRMVISSGGVFGDTIKTTTKDHYEYKKYEVVLPENISNIPLIMADLEVVAFIAEGYNNIYTGDKASVEVPDNVKTELAITDETIYPETIKLESIIPKVEVTNNGTMEVTKFDVKLLFAEKLFSKTFEGKLAKGEKTIIEFDEIKFTSSRNYSFEFSLPRLDIYAGNDNLVDIDNNNNFITNYFYGFVEKSIDTVNLSFELKNDVIDYDNVVFDMSQAVFNWRGWQDELGEYIPCGANNTTHTLAMILYGGQYAGKTAYLMLGEVDLTSTPSIPKKMLYYHYAYCDGGRNGTPPVITVEATRDWGITWQKISEIICQETGTTHPEYFYIPHSSEYKRIDIDLKDYANKDAIFRIGVRPGSDGNMVYIDEISISKNVKPIEDPIILDIVVYPNPTTTYLKINSRAFVGADYQIFDASGKVVAKGTNTSNTINVENLVTGSYNLKINDKFFRFIKE